MSKKKKESKEKEPEEEKAPRERKEIEFNLKDGVSWHDFVAIFLIFFRFIWDLLKWVLMPVVWVWNGNVRMFRFVRAKGYDRVMNDDERIFMESIPFLYTMTGIVGGLILGIFGWLVIQEDIKAILAKINENFFQAIWEGIAWLFNGIFSVLGWLLGGIGKFFGAIFGFFADLFVINPFLAFGLLAALGIVAVIIWIAFVETGAYNALWNIIVKVFTTIIGSPEKFRLRVSSFYRRMNHAITAFLVGKERLHTRTHVFFKRVVGYTIFLSLYSFAAGIFVATDPSSFGELDTLFKKVAFTAAVLFVAGVVSGTIAFALIARVLDFFNRKKYIASEFLRENEVDRDAMKSQVEKDEERIKEEMKTEQEEALAAIEAKARSKIERTKKEEVEEE